MTIDELVTTYHYKKLPFLQSACQRLWYLDNLPSWCNINGDSCILYAGSLPIANGYTRIVIGDYGAYIEISPNQIIGENIMVKPGEEYRKEERYKNVKYYWLCPVTDENVKIYWQRYKVSYADYQPMMFYVSPYEVNNGQN